MERAPTFGGIPACEPKSLVWARWESTSGKTTKWHALAGSHVDKVVDTFCGLKVTRVQLMRGHTVMKYEPQNPGHCRACRHEVTRRALEQLNRYSLRTTIWDVPDSALTHYRSVSGRVDRDISEDPPGIQWPTWADTTEKRKRWELALRTILAAFGWRIGESLDSADRTLVATGARTLFFGEDPTGDGEVTDEERAWMHEQGVL